VEWLTGVDWRAVFVPAEPLLEIVVRGSLIYLTLFALLRLFKRGTGAFGVSDLLLIVLVADAAQNAMAADYDSVPEGIVLVGTIVFWAFFLDWLAARVPAVERALRPPPLPLVTDGRLLRRNMRHELVSEQELWAQLREEGVSELSDVRRAYMEYDGRISVLRYNAS
jgi:uncharacterized membrane protein YcaP (DUF421 family)